MGVIGSKPWMPPMAATRIFAVVIAVSFFQISCASPTPNQFLHDKASVQLLEETDLRLEQIEEPTSARLDDMIRRGMNADNPGIQRVFIYFDHNMTSVQSDELTNLGITLYPDSWMPPAGSNPNGFLIADVPVDKLDELAAKTYVIKLDSAETSRKPQSLPH